MSEEIEGQVAADVIAGLRAEEQAIAAELEGGIEDERGEAEAG